MRQRQRWPEALTALSRLMADPQAATSPYVGAMSLFVALKLNNDSYVLDKFDSVLARVSGLSERVNRGYMRAFVQFLGGVAHWRTHGPADEMPAKYCPDLQQFQPDKVDPYFRRNFPIYTPDRWGLTMDQARLGNGIGSNI